MVLSWPKIGPKQAPDGSRQAQDKSIKKHMVSQGFGDFGPFERATKAKTAPRQPKTGQDRQKTLETIPRQAQDSLKTAQDNPGQAQNALKKCPRHPNFHVINFKKHTVFQGFRDSRLSKHFFCFFCAF